MTTIEGGTPLEAWKLAVEKLKSCKHETYNLVLKITDTNLPDRSIDFSDYDSRNVGGKDRVSAVINTIFPYKKIESNRDEIYSLYSRAHSINRKRKTSWGTYFQRLINSTDQYGQPVNQLEEAIRILNNWKNNPKTVIYFHLSGRNLDTWRPLGNPCLQYVQILAPNKTSICLTAVYRNHDYHGKALGNLYGLLYLGSFIARHTNRQLVEIVCHSVHATSIPATSKLLT